MDKEEKKDEGNVRFISDALVRHGIRNSLKPIHDSKVKGFCVRFNANGTATFIYRYRSKLAKKRPTMRIGQWHHKDMTASMARAKAKKLQAVVVNHGDPKVEEEERRREERKKLERERENKSQLLGTFIENFFKPHILRNKKGQDDLDRLNRRFTDWFGRNMLDLTRRDVTDWQHKWEKSLAYSSLKRDYGTLKRVLNYAVEQEVIKVSPLAKVSLKRPPAPTEDTDDVDMQNGERRALTKDEIKKLFRGLERYNQWKKDQRTRARQKKRHADLFDLEQVTYANYVVPAILVIYYAGFRPGDVIGLRWEHFNQDFTVISKVIEKSAHHGFGKSHFTIQPTLTRVMRDWWKQRGEPSIGYVFTSDRNKEDPNKRLNREVLRYRWKKVKELGGLDENLDLYTLRHNFASQLIMQNKPLKLISDLMGHRSIETTNKHYAHILQKNYEEALKDMGSVQGEPDFLRPTLRSVK